jgi:iron complex outermembrane recepter protein
MKNLSTTLRLSTLACACACACAVNAQTTPQLKEVVISGSRMEQELQTAPIGATVLLGSDIRNSGVLDANEAVRKLGGVTARSDLNGGREASIDLRGFGDSASSNMVVLIDGIRISENELASARLSSISPDLIERIEIVRGGASVVWGEGATAGIINVVTKVGKVPGISGSAQVGLESFGGRDARLALNVTGQGATFFAQARSYRTDGIRQNSSNNNDALNVGVQVGDDNGLKVKFSLFTEKLNARWPGALTYADYLINPKQSFTLKDNGTTQEDRATVTMQYRTGPWLFSLDLASRDRESKSFNDFDVFGDQEFITHSSSTQASPRVNYSDSWGGTAVSALVGIDKANWDYTRQSNFSGFLGADEKAHQTNSAGYFKTDFLFPTQTRLVLGARKERIAQDYVEQLTPTTSANSSRLSAWELGLNQTLAPQWDIYGRAAKSYRVANVDESRSLLTSLHPQTAKDSELGLRFNGADSSATVRVFRQKTVDEIAYDNPTFSNINLDPVRRTGLELDGRTRIDRAWTISGTLQVIKAAFSSGVNEGKAPPHVSKLNAAARVAYAMNAAHQVEIAVQRRGAAVLGNDWPNLCAQKTPARTTVDALYRYHASPDKGWSVTAGVDNLTNAKTFSWAFTNGTCSPVNVYPEVGRSFKINARYQF